jgi:hypothetical protein
LYDHSLGRPENRILLSQTVITPIQWIVIAVFAVLILLTIAMVPRGLGSAGEGSKTQWFWPVACSKPALYDGQQLSFPRVKCFTAARRF